MHFCMLADREGCGKMGLTSARVRRSRIPLAIRNPPYDVVQLHQPAFVMG